MPFSPAASRSRSSWSRSAALASRYCRSVGAGFALRSRPSTPPRRTRRSTTEKYASRRTLAPLGREHALREQVPLQPLRNQLGVDVAAHKARGNRRGIARSARMAASRSCGRGTPGGRSAPRWSSRERRPSRSPGPGQPVTFRPPGSLGCSAGDVPSRRELRNRRLYGLNLGRITAGVVGISLVLSHLLLSVLRVVSASTVEPFARIGRLRPARAASRASTCSAAASEPGGRGRSLEGARSANSLPTSAKVSPVPEMSVCACRRSSECKSAWDDISGTVVGSRRSR